MSAWRRLSLAAAAALVLHLAAGAAMLLILRRGLQTNADLAGRLAFLAEHRGLWAAGWLAWTLAGVSIIVFFACMAAAHDASRRVRGALLLLGFCAVACDWTAQYVEVFVLPGLVANQEAFLATHRNAVLLTGGAANAFYTAACAVLLWAGRGAYPRWVAAAGTAAVLFGTALTAASCADSTAGLFLANAGLVPFLLAWLGGIALTAWRRAGSS